MRIHKPRGITRGQFILVTSLGVIGGVYIWRPLFEQLFPKKKSPKGTTDPFLPTEEPELVTK